MRLNHNMFSLSAYKRYNKVVNENATAISRISTGLKIKSAKDNPKKIGQCTQIDMQLKSLNSASKNVQDTASLIQTAESGMNEMTSMLQRMRTLAVSAANGTKSEFDINVIQNEMNQLKEEITALSKNTTFNKVKMIGDTPKNPGATDPYEAVQAGSADTLVGFLSNERITINFYNLSSDNLIDDKGNKLSGVDVTSSDNAAKAINTIDAAINTVSKIRSEYGAVSQRLDTTATNIESNNVLINKAQSEIQDADIATEMVEYSRTNILYESSIAIIAQTNRIPMNALEALRNSR